MLALMRRLIISSVLALVAFAALASGASAATHTPVITSFSPSQVAVGQKLVLNGKYFKTGVTHNRVFFVRASDGKTVRARPSKASSTRRMEVIVPTAITPFLSIVNGQRSATRFEIYVLSGLFSKKTAKSKSPIILPAGTAGAPGSGGGTTGTTAPPADCDADGTPDAQDTDDDNDGLPDTVEAQIGTNPCKADTDGDGVSDGYEYYSALDLNGSNLPYPGSRPYPNPLDGTDAGKDFDGDGMTMAEEYAAWVYSGRILPGGPGQSFPYSDGNQTSPAGFGPGYMDLDGNGRITDDEKDADSDGLPNWLELHKTETKYSASSGCVFVPSTGPAPTHYGNTFTQCHGGPIMPNGNTFGNSMMTADTVNGTKVPDWLSTQLLNYLNPDTDGDGIPDGQDDNDFDGLSNSEEITAGVDGFYTEPQDPCDPNVNAPFCPLHA
jgi:thrombospondin type 3 repeat protein